MGRGSGRRRWPFLLVAGLALVGAAAAVAWCWWWPGYRPALRDGERFGVDVSNHQGQIDWTAVAGDGVEFAYIKATEGGDHVDARFAANWEGAGRAGLERGAYHFFTLCRPGRDQAANLLRALGARSAELPPAIDVELAGNCGGRPPRVAVLREVRSFLRAVEAALDQRVVVYLGADFEGRYDVAAALDRPVWHRRIFLRPDVGSWLIWQFHDRARVDGIDGGVDLNVLRSSSPPP